MSFVPKLLFAIMLSVLLTSCCAGDLFDNNDNVLPGVHNEGAGTDA